MGVQLEDLKHLTGKSLEERHEIYKQLAHMFNNLEQSSSLKGNDLQTDVLEDDLKSETDTNNRLIILHIVGNLLSSDKKNLTTCSQRKSLAQCVIDLMKNNKSKEQFQKIFWCLNLAVSVKFSDEYIRLFFESLKNIYENTNYQYYFCLDAITFIQRLVRTYPTIMESNISLVSKYIISQLFHPSDNFREISFPTYERIYPIFLQQRAEVSTVLGKLLKGPLLKDMILLFDKDEGNYVLKIWAQFVVLFGNRLHSGNSIRNALAEVIEKGFKSNNEKIVSTTFLAFKELIDNFALNKDHLTNTKKLQLLCRPMKHLTLKHDAVFEVVRDVYWHLLLCLGDSISNHFDLVCVSLLDAFLQTSSTNSPDASNGKLTVFQATTICEMLRHFLRRSPTKVKNSPLADLPDVIPLPILLRNFGKLMRATRIVSIQQYENVDEMEQLLKIVLALLLEVVHLFIQEMDSTEPVSSYVKLISDLVKFKFRSPKFCLEHLCPITVLPKKILTGPYYLLSNSSAMHENLATSLLGLFLNPYLQPFPKSNVKYMGPIKKLMNACIRETQTPLTYAQTFIRLIESEQVVKDVDRQELMKMWSSIAAPLCDVVQKTQEVNQGDSLENDFTCLNITLMYPLTYFISSQNSQSPFKTVFKLWSSMYVLFVRSAALVPSVQEDEICEDFCRRILDKVESEEDIEVPYFENLCQFLEVIVDNMESASEISAKRKFICPTVGFLKQKQPKELGNVTSIVSLLSWITDYFFKKHSSQEKYTSLHSSKFCVGVELVKRFILQFKRTSLIPLIWAQLAKPVLHVLTLSKENPRFVANIIEMFWKSCTLSILQNYKGTYNSEFLDVLTPILVFTLEYPDKSLCEKSRQFWRKSFGSSREKLKYSKELEEALLHSECLPQSFNDSISNCFFDNIPLTNSAAMDLKGNSKKPNLYTPRLSFGKNIVTSKFTTMKVVTPVSNSAKTPRKISFDSINDLPPNEFVTITYSKQSPVVIRSKQKSFVPPMYNDLSQDSISTSYIDSQPIFPSSNDSSEKNEKCSTGTVTDYTMEDMGTPILSRVADKKSNDNIVSSPISDSAKSCKEKSSNKNTPTPPIIELDDDEDCVILPSQEILENQLISSTPQKQSIDVPCVVDTEEIVTNSISSLEKSPTVLDTLDSLKNNSEKIDQSPPGLAETPDKSSEAPIEIVKKTNGNCDSDTSINHLTPKEILTLTSPTTVETSPKTSLSNEENGILKPSPIQLVDGNRYLVNMPDGISALKIIGFSSDGSPFVTKDHCYGRLSLSPLKSTENSLNKEGSKTEEKLNYSQDKAAKNKDPNCDTCFVSPQQKVGQNFQLSERNMQDTQQQLEDTYTDEDIEVSTTHEVMETTKSPAKPTVSDERLENESNVLHEKEIQITEKVAQGSPAVFEPRLTRRSIIRNASQANKVPTNETGVQTVSNNYINKTEVIQNLHKTDSIKGSKSPVINSVCETSSLPNAAQENASIHLSLEFKVIDETSTSGNQIPCSIEMSNACSQNAEKTKTDTHELVLDSIDMNVGETNMTSVIPSDGFIKVTEVSRHSFNVENVDDLSDNFKRNNRIVIVLPEKSNADLPLQDMELTSQSQIDNSCLTEVEVLSSPEAIENTSRQTVEKTIKKNSNKSTQPTSDCVTDSNSHKKPAHSEISESNLELFSPSLFSSIRRSSRIRARSQKFELLQKTPSESSLKKRKHKSLGPAVPYLHLEPNVSSNELVNHLVSITKPVQSTSDEHLSQMESVVCVQDCFKQLSETNYLSPYSTNSSLLLKQSDEICIGSHEDDSSALSSSELETSSLLLELLNKSSPGIAGENCSATPDCTPENTCISLPYDQESPIKESSESSLQEMTQSFPTDVTSPLDLSSSLILEQLGDSEELLVVSTDFNSTPELLSSSIHSPLLLKQIHESNEHDSPITADSMINHKSQTNLERSVSVASQQDAENGISVKIEDLEESFEIDICMPETLIYDPEKGNMHETTSETDERNCEKAEPFPKTTENVDHSQQKIASCCYEQAIDKLDLDDHVVEASEELFPSQDELQSSCFEAFVPDLEIKSELPEHVDAEPVIPETDEIQPEATDESDTTKVNADKCECPMKIIAPKKESSPFISKRMLFSPDTQILDLDPNDRPKKKQRFSGSFYSNEPTEKLADVKDRMADLECGQEKSVIDLENNEPRQTAVIHANSSSVVEKDKSKKESAKPAFALRGAKRRKNITPLRSPITSRLRKRREDKTGPIPIKKKRGLNLFNSLPLTDNTSLEKVESLLCKENLSNSGTVKIEASESEFGIKSLVENALGKQDQFENCHKTLKTSKEQNSSNGRNTALPAAFTYSRAQKILMAAQRQNQNQEVANQVVISPSSFLEVAVLGSTHDNTTKPQSDVSPICNSRRPLQAKRLVYDDNKSVVQGILKLTQSPSRKIKNVTFSEPLVQERLIEKRNSGRRANQTGRCRKKQNDVNARKNVLKCFASVSKEYDFKPLNELKEEQYLTQCPSILLNHTSVADFFQHMNSSISDKTFYSKSGQPIETIGEFFRLSTSDLGLTDHLTSVVQCLNKIGVGSTEFRIEKCPLHKDSDQFVDMILCSSLMCFACSPLRSSQNSTQRSMDKIGTVNNEELATNEVADVSSEVVEHIVDASSKTKETSNPKPNHLMPHVVLVDVMEPKKINNDNSKTRATDMESVKRTFENIMCRLEKEESSMRNRRQSHEIENGQLNDEFCNTELEVLQLKDPETVTEILEAASEETCKNDEVPELLCETTDAQLDQNFDDLTSCPEIRDKHSKDSSPESVPNTQNECAPFTAQDCICPNNFAPPEPNPVHNGLLSKKELFLKMGHELVKDAKTELERNAYQSFLLDLNFCTSKIFINASSDNEV